MMNRVGHFMAGVALAALPVTILALPAQASGGPSGANGTIKIDGAPVDSGHDNDPHVGCAFSVAFFGFDQGNLFANVTFNVQPPTGTNTTILQDHVFIGGQPAGGGVLDATQTYDLGPTLVGYAPQANQGYHIKVTTTTEQSDGKTATKSKVFWVTDCTTTPPPPPGG